MKPKFYLIIAGGRDFNDYDKLVREALKLIRNELVNHDVEIISGGANGADNLGERFANQYGFPLHVCKADWNTHGKRAGILRNMKMGDVAHGLLAFYDGESRGTGHMINYMAHLKKDYRVIEY